MELVSTFRNGPYAAPSTSVAPPPPGTRSAARGVQECLVLTRSSCHQVFSSLSCTGQESRAPPNTRNSHPQKSREKSGRPCSTSKSERVSRHGSAMRLNAPVDQVRDILDHAQLQVTVADTTGMGAGRPGALRLHRAEQVLLLTRLAADSGARRGELAALQLGDLDGDILTIARATSNEMVGPTKSGRIRRLTLGPTTAALWRHTVTQWRQRAGEGQPFGPWLFSSRADHATRLTTSCLAH